MVRVLNNNTMFGRAHFGQLTSQRGSKNPDYLGQIGTKCDDNTHKELCKEEPIMLKNSVSMQVHTCTASQPSLEHFFRFQGGPADRCLGVLEHMHLLSRAFYFTDVP